MPNAVGELKRHHFNVLLTLMSCGCLFFTEMQQQLIYHREAIIEHGQLWRLLTAPLVHYSIAHAALNLFSMAILVLCIGRNQPPIFFILFLLSSLGTSAYLLAFRPDVIWFAGLSAYASALLFWFLCSNYTSMPHRGMRAAMIAMAILFYTKLVLEALGLSSVLSLMSGSSFEVIWESHLIGSLCAIALFFIQRRLKTKR
ncbi:MAG: rhombosortase [Mariprofundaceae bacterium]|nr:rhombosortase [Mariprofundaceae bacterium]